MGRFKLVIAIPTSGLVSAWFSYSLAGLFGKLMLDRKIRTLPEVDGMQVLIDQEVSSNWIANRERLVMKALDADCTHLMFLDDDMAFHPTVLETLLGRRQPVVLTNYMIKTPDCDKFVAVHLNGIDRIPTTQDSTGIEPVSYSGFGVSVFETRVFRDIPQPWFQPEWDDKQKAYTTEDNPFFAKVRAAGYPVYVDHDASKLVSHWGANEWKWGHYRPTLEVKPNGE